MRIPPPPSGPFWLRTLSTRRRAWHSCRHSSCLPGVPTGSPRRLPFLGSQAWTDRKPRGVFSGLPTGFLAPLNALRVTVDSLLGVESDGTVRQTETTSGASRFDQRIPGIFAAVAVSPTELIAGRNSAAAPGGSLLRVDTRTRETVAIKDRNAFTYGLLLDASDAGGAPILYSVGIDASGGTNLIRHGGPGFEQETLLGRVSEEDLDVSLALDQSTHVLYATLGHDSVSAWDGTQMKEIALQNTAPRRLVARAGQAFLAQPGFDRERARWRDRSAPGGNLLVRGRRMVRAPRGRPVRRLPRR